jgi:hypothetical protein
MPPSSGEGTRRAGSTTNCVLRLPPILLWRAAEETVTPPHGSSVDLRDNDELSDLLLFPR